MTPREIAEALRAAKSLNADDLEPLRVYTEAKRATGAPLAVEEAVLSAAHECREAFRVLVRATESERGSREYALDVFKAQGIASRLQGFVLAQQHDQTVAVLYEVHRVRREAFLMLVDVFASVADRIVATPEEQAAETARANAILAAARTPRTVTPCPTCGEARRPCPCAGREAVRVLCADLTDDALRAEIEALEREAQIAAVSAAFAPTWEQMPAREAIAREARQARCALENERDRRTHERAQETQR